MWSAIGIIGGVCVIVGFLQLASLRRHRGILSILQGTISGLIWLAVGGLAMVCWLALHAFYAFAGSVPVAEVHCKWIGSQHFELTYQPIQHGQLGPPQQFQLRGDQWAISGGIVKWHPWLTALGVPSYHKPTRLSGRFMHSGDEAAAPPTVCDLNGGDDRVWWLFYRLDPYLPFVDAVYGSAAFLTVNPTLVAEVSVTPSGYLIKQKRPRTPVVSEPAAPRSPF